jgi:hypothetical protein
MRSNRLIVKSIAILLLLVFSQKIGLGIHLHNWLHINNCKPSSSQPAANTISYNCNCIDDFSMPFAEPATEVATIISIPHQSFISFYIQPLSIFFPVYNSLRAPPVFLS